MPRAGDAPMPFERLLELAMQADAQGRCRFTPFLTPPEAALAEAAARRAGVLCALYGGYAGAERCMARFCPGLCEPAPFPLATLRVTWPHQSAPAHRDLLGALMGLGLRRDRTGDIVLSAQEATLFVEAPLADTAIGGLTEASRIRLHVERAEATPPPEANSGEAVRFTVASARLDAIVADGFHLSRGDAAALVAAGAVKLRHAPTLRPDARVSAGDAISVRGHGRLTVEAIGEPTRKGRLPVTATRHGTPR
jgi:RNA-binding protein YlmH